MYVRGEDGREKRAHRNLVLGLVKQSRVPENLSIAESNMPQLTESEARSKLQQLIATHVGAGVPSRPDSRVTFGWFWRNRWLPLVQGNWRPKTKKDAIWIIEEFIAPRWDSIPLKDLDVVHVSDWLAKTAADYSHSVVMRVRIYMRAITAEALNQDYYTKDPLRKLKLPQTKPEARPVLTLEQARAIMKALDNQRDRLVFGLMLICGLRPGETFALRWNDLRPEGIFIDESFGETGILGPAKTDASRALVAVPASMLADLETVRKERRAEGKGYGPTDWIFPASRGPKPLTSVNWLKRVLKPVSKELGIPVDNRMLRRSCATLANAAGVALKSVQAQLRHTSVTTTANIYVQAITAAQQAAVEGIAKNIFPCESRQ